MKSKAIIGLMITCLLFSLPVLSMNSRDNKPQGKTDRVPIAIIKGTSTLHRSNSMVPISAYYQSGYVVFDFYEMREGALITISNTNTNESVDYLVNSSDSSISINISGIMSGDIFEILIITESGENYCGIFAL